MLKINFIPAEIPAGDALVLTVAADKKLGAYGAELDKKLGGAIKRAIDDSSFTGAKEQTLGLAAPAKSKLARIVLIGIGDPAKVDEITMQRSGGSAIAALKGGKSAHATLLVDEHKSSAIPAHEAAANAAFGMQLASYRFDKYRTTMKPEQKSALKSVDVAAGDVSAARKAYSSLDKIAESVFFVRDLVREPANVLYPETLAAKCEELKSLGVKVEILDEKQLKKLGMGALLGVAQGSAHPARVVTMSWQGDAKAKDKRPVAFVGKGVTFDSGGISIKPANGMEEMKYDMAGAGAVIGAIKALAARKAKANVVGVIGIVENMPSGTAQRPGDVVTSMSGQTIEVINTDAEGRLVLADAVWYAQEKFNPRCVVDLATLTGAIIIALGHEYGGIFSNDDELADKLIAAGKAADEPLWRFPMGEAYDKMMDSGIADVRNSSNERDAGSITGAQFIKRFVKKDTAWAHLDIAGVARQSKDRPTCPKGATAFGVRLLERFVAEYCEG